MNESKLLSTLQDFFEQHGLKPKYWVAYSGGLDSHVLLTLCHALRNNFPLQLRAVHVNHGLSPHADQWAAYTAKVCEKYDIPFVLRRVQLEREPGDSLEAIAREKRYALLADCLEHGDILLTAHQQDDQAETLLLQLLRGAGPKGLSAMPAFKPFAHGFHGRPLLSFTRQQLLDYALSQSLEWIEDESNTHLAYSRNFIRHDIMPLLKARFPSVTATLARSAAHCAETENVLQIVAQENSELAQGSREGTLSVSQLVLMKKDQQKLVLRYWIVRSGFTLPDSKKLETILSDVLSADDDRMPCVNWQGAELRRYRDDLYLMTPLQPHDAAQMLVWNLNETLILAGIGKWNAVKMQGRGLSTAIQEVSVRFRQGGEVLALAGRGRHTLKNLFQEWGVVPWERERIPLLFLDDKLIAVWGYGVDVQVLAKEGEEGWGWA